MFFSVQTINLGFLEAILSILKTFCEKKKLQQRFTMFELSVTNSCA